MFNSQVDKKYWKNNAIMHYILIIIKYSCVHAAFSQTRVLHLYNYVHNI